MAWQKDGKGPGRHRGTVSHITSEMEEQDGDVKKKPDYPFPKPTSHASLFLGQSACLWLSCLVLRERLEVGVGSSQLHSQFQYPVTGDISLVEKVLQILQQLKESLIDLSRAAISSLKKGDTSWIECPPGMSFNDLLPLEALLSRTASQLPDRKPPPQDWRMLAWKMSFEPLENLSSLWYLQYCLTVQQLSVV